MPDQRTFFQIAQADTSFAQTNLLVRRERFRRRMLNDTERWGLGRSQYGFAKKVPPGASFAIGNLRTALNLQLQARAEDVHLSPLGVIRWPIL